MWKDTGVRILECVGGGVLVYMYEFVKMYKDLHACTRAYVLYVPLCMHGSIVVYFSC